MFIENIFRQPERDILYDKTRFISPLGEIFIDAVNKGLRSNQTAISANEVKLKQGLVDTKYQP